MSHSLKNTKDLDLLMEMKRTGYNLSELREGETTGEIVKKGENT